jgi:hypothetical protein
VLPTGKLLCYEPNRRPDALSVPLPVCVARIRMWPEALCLLHTLLAFVRCAQALTHEFFDELRLPSCRLPGDQPLPDTLFDFTPDELQRMQTRGIARKLVSRSPSRARTPSCRSNTPRPDSHRARCLQVPQQHVGHFFPVPSARAPAPGSPRPQALESRASGLGDLPEDSLASLSASGYIPPQSATKRAGAADSTHPRLASGGQNKSSNMTGSNPLQRAGRSSLSRRTPSTTA